MLKVANVTVRYDKHIALSNVAVEVARGEIVTILGANGAGKTTLLKSIARLVRPDLGAVVSYNDCDLLAIAPHQVVRTVAMVPEGRGLFADLTVRDVTKAEQATSPERSIALVRSTCFSAMPAMTDL
jgi:ABC-type branched-subunit amino acid transport system ATPase component